MIYRRIVFFLCILLTACTTAAPVSTGVLLPEGYRENFVQYARVDREDAIIRELYIHPNALEQVRAGRLLADGTVIVIEAYHAQLNANDEPLLDEKGHFIKGEPLEMVHVIEKRPDWTAADFASDTRTTGRGDWNFGSYQFGAAERFDEDLNACFNCHNTTPQTDFVYTYPLLVDFVRSGQVQYFYCDIAGRIACQLR
jgi:hypothetical protein